MEVCLVGHNIIVVHSNLLADYIRRWGHEANSEQAGQKPNLAGLAKDTLPHDPS
jgi:hypothetical protein